MAGAGVVFLDSCAVVKWYADEPHSEEIRALAGPCLVAEIARVEVAAAIWRKQRMGEMSSGDAQILTTAFAADVSTTGRFAVVAATSAVIGHAAELVARHPLRAYDAVQLAAALAARSSGVIATFACFDSQLNRAAAAEGLALFGS